MDDRTDGLWQGGPWEQPAPPVPGQRAVWVPPGARRPALRVKKRRRRRWPGFLGLVVLVAAACMVTIALSGRLPMTPELFSSRGEEESRSREFSTEPPSIRPEELSGPVDIPLLPAGEQALTYTQIYEQNIRSFVSIASRAPDGYGTGSGVVLTEDGCILTNAHVVAGAREVLVRLHDNRTFAAGLVGFDAREDLAVLKIDAGGLTPARFGDSGALRCGDPVAALGDSLGYQGTFTDGIISALDREMDVDGVNMTLIQTSAAINFGNSGGPLFNQYGQVVGVTTIKVLAEDGSAESMGFAIPSARVKYVAEQLIAGNEVRLGVFGFSVSTIPVEEGGLELLSLEENSDALAQGMRPGDIIQAINGQPVNSVQELSRTKQGLGPGDKVMVTFLRDGVSYTLEVALVDAELGG